MMPERQRSILIRHEFEGASIRELAEELSVPFFTAATRIRRARERFAKAVKQLQGRGRRHLVLLPPLPARPRLRWPVLAPLALAAAGLWLLIAGWRRAPGQPGPAAPREPAVAAARARVDRRPLPPPQLLRPAPSGAAVRRTAAGSGGGAGARAGRRLAFRRWSGQRHRGRFVGPGAPLPAARAGSGDRLGPRQDWRGRGSRHRGVARVPAARGARGRALPAVSGRLGPARGQPAPPRHRAVHPAAAAGGSAPSVLVRHPRSPDHRLELVLAWLDQQPGAGAG